MSAHRRRPFRRSVRRASCYISHCGELDGRIFARPRGSSRMYTLYYSPGTASLAVHLALLEIGAPHELIKLDLDAGEQNSPAYLALNPNAVVPTLIVDGRPVAESAGLLMLLAERHPEARLAPAPGTPLRPVYLQWMLHFANTVQPGFRS